MKSNLVLCPKCRREINIFSKQLHPNVSRPLGEVTAEGEFLIAPPGGIKVLITGPEFFVKCGHCGEIALKIERRTNERVNNRPVGIHWGSFSGTFIETRT